MVVGWRRAQSPTPPNCGGSPGRHRDQNLAGDLVLLRSTVECPGWSSFHNEDPRAVGEAVSHFDNQQ